MKPSAPAFATAATSSARPTHCIPPWAMGASTPNVSVNFVFIVISVLGLLCLSSSRSRSTRRHPDRAVESARLAVEHRVLHDMHRQRTVFVRVTEAGRMRYLLAQRRLRLLRQRAQQR